MYMIECKNVRDLRSSPIHLVMNDIFMFNICLSAHAELAIPRTWFSSNCRKENYWNMESAVYFFAILKSL